MFEKLTTEAQRGLGEIVRLRITMRRDNPRLRCWGRRQSFPKRFPIFCMRADPRKPRLGCFGGHEAQTRPNKARRAAAVSGSSTREAEDFGERLSRSNHYAAALAVADSHRPLAP